MLVLILCSFLMQYQAQEVITLWIGIKSQLFQRQDANSHV